MKRWRIGYKYTSEPSRPNSTIALPDDSTPKKETFGQDRTERRHPDPSATGARGKECRGRASRMSRRGFLAPPRLEELETLALARDPHSQESVLPEGLGDARRRSVSSDDGTDAPVSERRSREGQFRAREEGQRRGERTDMKKPNVPAEESMYLDMVCKGPLGPAPPLMRCR